MSRATFGGTAGDFVASVGSDRLLRAVSATLTLWDAETGGTQVTDLLLDGSPVTEIPVGRDGQVPEFQGPDGVAVMWAEAGGSRVRLDPEGFPGGPASDEAVSTYLANPASDSRATLDGLIEAATDLIGRYFDESDTTPVAFLHRNAHFVVPEQTEEGMIAAAGLGVPNAIIDTDVNALAGGGVGMMHDSTVDRTTTSTGNVADFSVPQWMTLRSDAGAWFAPAWADDLKVPLATWALDFFGGTTGLSMEPKSDLALTRLVAEIQKRGLTKQVVLNSSNLTRIAAIKAAGIHATYYFPTPGDAANATLRGQVLAAAPDSIVVQTGTAPADLATIVGWGIPILAGETDRRWEWEQFRAAGCAGIVANDPVYTLGLAEPRVTDTWASQTFGSGYLHVSGPPNRSGSLTFVSGEKMRFVASASTPTGGAENSVLIGECSPASADGEVVIDLYVTVSTLPADMSRYFQIAVRDTDRQVLFGAGPSTTYNGYGMNIRATGAIEVYRSDAGVGATSIASKTTGITAFTAGERRHIRLTIGASTITGEDVDHAYSASVVDTTRRAPWFLTLGRADTVATGVGVWDVDGLAIT